MAKLRKIQNALNAGELSPLLWGRTEVPRYGNGLERCRNAIPLVTGGVTRRPGFRHVAVAAGPCRLLPQLVMDGLVRRGNVLELSDQLCRFYTNSARVESAGNPVEMATPYLETELDAIHHGQQDDDLYLVHPLHPPAIMATTAIDAWSYSAPLFKGPWESYKAKTKTITPSAATGTVTLTASATLFDAADVGRVIAIGYMATARANSTAYVVGDIRSSKKNLYICTEAGTSGTEAVTGTDDAISDGTVTWDYYLPGNVNYGLATITAVASGTSATATVSLDLPKTTASKYWTWAKWSDVDGYPSAICFHEQRLLLAGTASHPTTFWGSKNGVPLSFQLGTSANDSYEFAAAGASCRINQLHSFTRGVLLMTAERELVASGAGGSAGISPTSIDIRPSTSYGTSPTTRPVAVGGDVLLPSVSGQRLRLHSYQYDNDKYTAPDYAMLADHLLLAGGGIVRACYMREPWPACWCVTAAGHLLCLVLDQEQQVVAWSRHGTTDAARYLDCCAIPGPDGADQLWTAVERTVAGAVQVHVEYLDPSLQTDAAATGTLDPPGRTVTGLQHLEGQTVQLKGDGVVFPPAVVSGGSVTYPADVTAWEVGLGYAMTVTTLPVEMGQPGGTIQGTARSVVNSWVLLHDTQGVSINGETIPFRSFDAPVFNLPPAGYTGWKSVGDMGWSRSGENTRVTITADQPLPCTVLAVLQELTAND